MEHVCVCVYTVKRWWSAAFSLHSLHCREWSGGMTGENVPVSHIYVCTVMGWWSGELTVYTVYIVE